MRTWLQIAMCAIAFSTLFAAEQPVANSGNTITLASRVVTYQGILRDNSGNPVGDGDYNIIFRLYDAPSAGTLLWMETVTVTTESGYFTCTLGQVAPLNLPFNADYYLAIQVQGDTQMPDRQRLTLSPYAARSDSADFAIDIANNAVTSIKITDGAILFGDIAQNGASSGQVMKWNGSIWTAANDEMGANSGWVDNGTRIGLSASGDSVGIGTSFPSAKLHVEGDFKTVGRANIGYGCLNNGYRAFVMGDNNNASADWSSIGGGSSNMTDGFGARVSGGETNTASGNLSFIGGGWQNSVLGTFSCIGSGRGNKAGDATTDTGAFVGGGNYNFVGGKYGAVPGGFTDSVSGDYAVIGGGRLNKASGTYSVVLGGYGNSASGEGSMAYGLNVSVNTLRTFCLYDAVNSGRFGLNRDADDGGALYSIHVGTNTGNGNGAYLSYSGVWTNGSSRTFKENFTPFEGEELLSKISSLSITTYNFIGSTEKHVGPVAEEFVGAFDTGVIREDDGKRDDKYLAASDVAGVALAGVQELLKKIEALENRVAELEAEKR